MTLQVAPDGSKEPLILSMRKRTHMGKTHFIALHFTALHRYWIFHRSKVFGNPTSSMSTDAIFPTTCAYFVPLGHVLIIFIIFFKIFHYYYICYGALWSVIFDVTLVIVLGHHEPCSYKMANLIDEYYIYSDCSINWSFLHLSPSPWTSLLLEALDKSETQQYWKPVNNPATTSVYSSESKSCTSIILHRKLKND